MITLPNIAMKATVKTDAEPSVSTDPAAGADALVPRTEKRGTGMGARPGFLVRRADRTAVDR